jgi:hypothetical protein
MLRAIGLTPVATLCACLFLVPLRGWAPCVVFSPRSDPAFTVGQSAIYIIDEGRTARYRVVLVPRA